MVWGAALGAGGGPAGREKDGLIIGKVWLSSLWAVGALGGLVVVVKSGVQNCPKCDSGASEGGSRENMLTGMGGGEERVRGGSASGFILESTSSHWRLTVSGNVGWRLAAGSWPFSWRLVAGQQAWGEGKVRFCREGAGVLPDC